MPQMYYTERELAETLKMSIRTIQGWRRKGSKNALPHIKIGKSIRYPVDSVEAFLSSRTI